MFLVFPDGFPAYVEPMGRFARSVVLQVFHHPLTKRQLLCYISPCREPPVVLGSLATLFWHRVLCFSFPLSIAVLLYHCARRAAYNEIGAAKEQQKFFRSPGFFKQAAADGQRIALFNGFFARCHSPPKCHRTFLTSGYIPAPRCSHRCALRRAAGRRYPRRSCAYT